MYNTIIYSNWDPRFLTIFYGETIIIIGFSKAKRLGLHVHAMTAHKRSRGTNPLILNLGTRWQ